MNVDTFNEEYRPHESYGGHSRVDTDVGTDSISTVNDLGSHIRERMKKNLQTSLRRMDVNEGYTPIAESTKNIYQTLQISTIAGIPDDGSWVDSTTGVNGTENRSHNGLGSADVMNPPFQFGPHDDVRTDPYYPKFGRVFNDSIRGNYPIVVFEVGRIKYNTGMVSKLLGDSGFISTNSEKSLRKMIKGELGLVGMGLLATRSAIQTAAQLVVAPVTMVKELLFGDPFSKFENDTSLYSQYLDEILARVAITMGLYNPILGNSDTTTNDAAPEDAPNSDSTSAGRPVGFSASDSSGDDTGLDYGRQLSGTGDSTGYANDNVKRLSYLDMIPANAHYTRDYIPFMLHKDVQVNESISNSTEVNPLQTSLNEKAKEAAFTTAGGDAEAATQNIVSAGMTRAMNALERLKNGFGKAEQGFVLDGDGRMNMPEVWADSNFDRTFALNFKFTSPYGDDLSVFENTYIPFIMLLVMSMPRQTGKQSFTSPFILRVYSKGWFNCPLGIVESMSIERGEEKNNWTVNGRPRSIKVTLNIKDMSPSMMMSINRGWFNSLYTSNVGFTSYLDLLGGLSVSGQKDMKARLERFYAMNEKRFSDFWSGGIDKFIFDHGSKTFPYRAYAAIKRQQDTDAGTGDSQVLKRY